MIITRSPLRISLGGGGTDLPSYYREHGGFVIAAAIDKYVYITLHTMFQPGYVIKYSSMEKVATVNDIQHPIVREALALAGCSSDALEITSMADIPAGTGLGSSGSFTTALLKALHMYKRNLVHPRDLAEQACDIELNRLGEPIGKQDQYIAAFGGLTCFTFNKDGSVDAAPLNISKEVAYELEDSLVMFFTGFMRSASAILKEQDVKSKARDAGMAATLHRTKEIGWESKEAFESGDIRRFGELMHLHWEEKKKRSGAMSNPHIDEWYALARQHGALGGKLIGAGGGGFLLLCTQDKARLRQGMAQAGLEEVRFKFDFEGTKAVI